MTTERQHLVPILREGVEVVKMIFFMELRDHLRRQQSEAEAARLARLCGAVVNAVFGADNQEPAYLDFVRAHRDEIDQLVAAVGRELDSLRIPLTDALRTMVLCDHQEGRDSSELLRAAQEAGILLLDRDLPLPNHFIDLVHRLGTAKGLLAPRPVPTAD